MQKIVSYILGVLSFLPLIFFIWFFFGSIYGIYIGNHFVDKAFNTYPAMRSIAMAIVVLHYGLIVFYIKHLIDHPPAKNKELWAVAIILFNLSVFPLYWWVRYQKN